MSTTLWKPQFVVNPTAGNQLAPVSVGLRNGNILVMWQDDNNTSGPSPNNDIVGQLFDPEGNAIGGPFQVNTAYVNSGETEPQVVALPDGGWVVAYGAFIDSPTVGGFIAIQRYNAAGQPVFSDAVLDNGQNTLANWDLVVDAAGNYTIAFERGPESDGAQQVKAIRWNHNNNGRSSEHSAAQNSTEDDDFLGDIATFANGNLITISHEEDFDDFDPGYYTAEFKIINPETGAVVLGPTEFTEPVYGGEQVSSQALDVATLSGGQFVLLYHRFEASYAPIKNLAIRIGSDGAPGLSLSVEIFVADGHLLDAQVVALRDGGFMVVWSDQAEDRIFGARYDAAGAKIGATLPIALGTAGVGESAKALGSVSLASDGRVLVSYRTGNGEIALVIVDPRDGFIQGAAGDDVITGRLENSTIQGLDGQDILLGQGGHDSLNGGLGADLLDGGGGDDTYVLDTTHLVTNGGGGFFQAYDTVQEGAASGVDTVRVRRVDVFGAPNGYTLTSHVENGVVDGTEAFDLFGNVLTNRLTGNGAANRLEGLDGNDVLAGGLGADTLVGGTGSDDYVLDNVHTVLTGGGIPRNHYDAVVEAAGEGYDRVFVQQLRGENGVLTTTYTLTANVESGVIQGTADFSLVGNERDNLLIGNAAVNTLDGLDGDDSLDGGAGADTMDGGRGDDIYVIDNAGDRIGAGENRLGTQDLIYGDVHVNTLTNGGVWVESVILTGSGHINAIGNRLDNLLVGNTGNNTLNGYLGADRMEGGLGVDTYIVDNLGDQVIETGGAAGGVDRVQALISWTLGDSLEHLQLLGVSDIDGTGNDQTNNVIGNGGDNRLTGGGGYDVLQGRGGVDTFVYTQVSDSTRSLYDRIMDLGSDDFIDLAAIDANSRVAGNQDFALAGAFTRVAGQLVLSFNAAGNFTELQGDVDGNGTADFRIVLLRGDHTGFDGFLGVN